VNCCHSRSATRPVKKLDQHAKKTRQTSRKMNRSRDEATTEGIAAEAIDSAAPSAQPAPAAPAPAQPATAAEADYIEEVRKLAGLKEAGIIADEEFEAKKRQLLGL
jgi:hypothetical protein